MSFSRDVERRTGEFVRPPEFIDSKNPFIAIGDLDVVTEKVSPVFQGDKGIAGFQARILALQAEHAPDDCSFYYVPQRELLSRVEAKVLDFGPDVAVLNFDRYIFGNTQPRNYLKLELSRGADNKLIQRPGSSLNKDQQLQLLVEWLKAGDFKKVLLVDDVIAFATTSPPIAEIIRQALPEAEINAVAGICSSQGNWAGKERLEALGIQVESVITARASEPVEGGTSGMAIPDSRDSTIFGGKIGQSPDGTALSYPYFLPFSTPTTSLMKAELRGIASLEWLQINIDLVQYMDGRLGRPLIFQDLLNNGFGIPYTSIDAFKPVISIPDASESVLVYLQNLQRITPDLLGMNGLR